MKCPKCGYLGFETSDRCRNCGYDFSLAAGVESPPELPLRSSDVAEAPLADFALSDASGPADTDSSRHLNLDRVIGAPSAPAPPGRAGGGALPLFAADSLDEVPPITPPRPARPPLAVRRTTPEAQRGRSRPMTPQLEILDEGSDTPPETPADRAQLPRAPEVLRAGGEEFRPASASARLIAALIDIVLLTIIDAIVVYLTLALAGLDRESIGTLPLAPLAGFFAILNGGYLIGFIAASGQTVGKMITGIRVMGDDGQRVDVGGAILRAAGCGLSILTVGLGYLPAFVTAHGRALQDRIAGTRVVSARTSEAPRQP